MKNLVIIGLASTCFVSSAFGESTFICAAQNQVVHLRPQANAIVAGDHSLPCRHSFASDQDKEFNMEQPVYKVLRENEWREFQSQGYFSGSKDDLNDGFIHLSPADQVERIIKKYFSTDRPIYIVKFDNLDFLKRLVWEPASNGDLYPHLYNTSLSIDEMDSFEVRE